MTLTTGTRLGPYGIVFALGAGGPTSLATPCRASYGVVHRRQDRTAR